MKFLLYCIILSFTINLFMTKIKNRRFRFSIKSEKTKEENTFLDEDLVLKYYGAVYVNDEGQFVLSSSRNEDSSLKLVAECNFSKVIDEKGWDKISIRTYRIVNSYQQAYMAGYLEGRMTSDDIFNFYNNLRLNNLKVHKESYEKMVNFFAIVAESFSKKMENIKSDFNEMNKKDRKFWSKILLGYSQLEGVIKGYTAEITRKGEYETKKLSVADFLILQADGEVPELLRYFNSQSARKKHVRLGDPNYFRDAFGIDTKDPNEFWGHMMWNSKCSAFIKLSKDEKGNWKDLLAGHTTWTEYYELLRSYKHYKFELDNKGTFENSEITFSSYPGCISSTDDFYLTNHNLLVMETTLEVIDINLYSHIKSPEEYIPNFTRVLAATRFAKTAEEWASFFSNYNSGTYSSQWMIIDYKIFAQIKGSNKRQPKLLYMMEQTPNRIVYHDISDYLYQHGYFGSYNRAFLDKTKNDLNVALVKHLYGTRFGYFGANRAKIFKAMNEQVSDLKSLKDILRYNGYKLNNFPNDPSANHPGEGISARYDLERSTLNNLSGGIDCKVTNFEMSQTLTSVAISGPTNENNKNLTPFDWSKINEDIIREGVPVKFNFPYILMSPATLCCDNTNDIYTFPL